MRIRLISISQKPPAWLTEGFSSYAKRLPPTCALELIEIPAEKRLPHISIPKIIEREGEKMMKEIKTNHLVIALNVIGENWSTEALANKLSGWQQSGQNIDLLIGGPDGISSACLKLAKIKWSLSSLTFPHLLVRLIVAEQLYRAWSILQKHPYHRA